MSSKIKRFQPEGQYSLLMAYTGSLRSKRIFFFRLWLFVKRVGNSRVEGYERVGKIVI